MDLVSSGSNFSDDLNEAIREAREQEQMEADELSDDDRMVVDPPKPAEVIKTETPVKSEPIDEGSYTPPQLMIIPPVTSPVPPEEIFEVEPGLDRPSAPATEAGPEPNSAGLITGHSTPDVNLARKKLTFEGKENDMSVDSEDNTTGIGLKNITDILEHCDTPRPPLRTPPHIAHASQLVECAIRSLESGPLDEQPAQDEPTGPKIGMNLGPNQNIFFLFIVNLGVY